MVDADVIGVFIGDFNGRILEANDAFLRIVGYDREDLAAGRINWKDLTPRDWCERDAQWIEEHKRTGVRLPIEKEYFRKDGSRVPILLGSATVEEGGNQSVTFVIDLTERKQAEERQKLLAAERKRAEYLTERVFDSLPDGLSIVGTDYRYVRVNPLYERVWNIPVQSDRDARRRPAGHGNIRADGQAGTGPVLCGRSGPLQSMVRHHAWAAILYGGLYAATAGGRSGGGRTRIYP